MEDQPEVQPLSGNVCNTQGTTKLRAFITVVLAVALTFSVIGGLVGGLIVEHRHSLATGDVQALVSSTASTALEQDENVQLNWCDYKLNNDEWHSDEFPVVIKCKAASGARGRFPIKCAEYEKCVAGDASHSSATDLVHDVGLPWCEKEFPKPEWDVAELPEVVKQKKDSPTDYHKCVVGGRYADGTAYIARRQFSQSHLGRDLRLRWCETDFRTTEWRGELPVVVKRKKIFR